MRLGVVGIIMGVGGSLMAAPSQAMLSRYEGKVSGYYGAVMVVTKDRIDHDNATLQQLGVNHRIGTHSRLSSPTVYEADDEAYYEVERKTEKTTPTASVTPSKGITMAEFVANQIRVAATNADDAFLVASNWE